MMREFDWTIPDSVELMTPEECKECNSRIIKLLEIINAVLEDKSTPPQE